MGVGARSAVRKWLTFIGMGVICISLGSCSLFESKIRVPVAKKTDIPPPPQITECEKPYCSENLDLPLFRITKPEIYVIKSERRLCLVQDKTLVREFHIGLGPSPRGDKYFQGDGRTPEGDYFVCAKNTTSQYYKSLGINYPSPRHAENALASGVISYNEYTSIVQANDSMRLPPPNTRLGGAIFIHGGGCVQDWTLGCVAINNSAIDQLFEVVSIGTPIHILP